MAKTYLDILYMEYLAVVDHILKGKKYISRSESAIFIDRQIISAILSKYEYLTEFEKLKYWKQLRFINTETNRLTWQYIDKQTGNKKRVISINLETYNVLKKFQPRSLTEKNLPRNLYNKVLKNNSKTKYELMRMVDG